MKKQKMICSENSKDLKIYLILQNIALRVINYLIVSVFVLFLSYYFELSASAGYSLAMTLCLCLSLCLSQASVLSKWMDGSSWFLAWLFLWTYRIPCIVRKFNYKMRILFSGTLS